MTRAYASSILKILFHLSAVLIVLYFGYQGAAGKLNYKYLGVAVVVCLAIGAVWRIVRAPITKADEEYLKRKKLRT